MHGPALLTRLSLGIEAAGIRLVPPRGPGLMIEFRNHHISNAGTAGTNLGINAATLMAGVQWVLR